MKKKKKGKEKAMQSSASVRRNVISPQRMLLFGDVFKHGQLCLFCDASTMSGGSETVGAPGAIAIAPDNNGKPILIDASYMLLRMSTNNESEITAIQLGVNLALKYKGVFETFVLFSDSQICIYALREWLPTWVRHSKQGDLRNAGGKSIANQEIMKSIVVTVVRNQLNIRFYHQKGHAHNKIGDTVTMFARSNNIFLSTELALELSNWNDFIDRYTGDVLENANINYSNTARSLLPMTRYRIDKDMLTEYLKLIRD
jgi:ribonuclease HI